MPDDRHYDTALRDILSPRAAFRPPRRVSVSEGAAQNLVIKQTGGPATPWSPHETPYMVEPMDMLASRRHEGEVFVGPARTGKTGGLILGFMAHAVVNDPGDMLIVQMTQEKARDFSKTDVSRALRYSNPLKERLSTHGKEVNLHDMMFTHGMWLKIAWPTIGNLSGSTYRYALLTDYDRMPDDIDGEGAPFPLAKKRTTTFMSRGMAAAESSPGRELVDPNWRPATAHEAPPCGGILGLYNSTDRRRWYWKCPDCSEWFEAAPGLGLFNLPSDEELGRVVREANLDALADDYNRIICPHCGVCHGPKTKARFNAAGRWLRDGQRLTADDEIEGDGATSTLAGYWMGGVAATFQSWKSMLTAYFQALRQYELTGDEEALKNTTNLDQGMPYMSRLLRDAALAANDPADRKETDLQRHVVPDQARFLVASVDIQGGTNSRFVVQVHAVGVNLEQWLVDRYEITESNRDGMGTVKAPIDPAAYAEDWDVLTERVVRSTYRTSTPGQEMRVKLTVVDSGGEDGVTDKAYAWFRRIRRAGMAQRVMLVKGASVKGAPMVKETLQGGRNSKERGDVPVYLLNPNLLKDAVSTGLKRPTPGPNYIHFPAWLKPAFFDELKAEVRAANGVWQQIRKRNESFDLCYYIRAGCLRLGADKIKWDAAPAWARPLATNSERITKEERRELQANTPMAPVPTDEPRPARQRRTARSSYMG